MSAQKHFTISEDRNYLLRLWQHNNSNGFCMGVPLGDGVSFPGPLSPGLQGK